MANDKTEKATPKKKADARKKGQVARSADLNGAVVLMTGILVLAVVGGTIAGRMADLMRSTLAQTVDPSVVEKGGVGKLLAGAGTDILASVAPIALACALAGVLVTVAQVGWKPSMHGLKPDPKRLNPGKGFKQIFGPNAPVEGAKSIAKLGVIGVIVAMTILPQITQFGAMVGISPIALSSEFAHLVRGLAIKAAAAYLLIGVVDLVWQRHRNEKAMRMDKQEIKEEQKGYSLPPEIRAAMRRRQMAAARKRMMEAVPTADVIVTNPTHFSVALKYDGASLAPEVVAKGQDIVALKIRELAAAHGVPVVPDPPLARALHASVEVGQQIPEELYHGVAQVLAFVYRTAARRRMVAA